MKEKSSEEKTTLLNSVQEIVNAPHYISTPELEEIQELFSGEDLRTADVAGIMSGSPTRMIVLAGAADAGKTTLLVTIMHLFHKGGIGDYIFAGSRTLPAFERRAFDSYITSGRSVPTTQHTVSSLDDIKFLHLAVRKKTLDEPTINLLFTDISGENFRQARDSAEECKKLWVLHRADYFALLLDGGRIAEPTQRQHTKIDGITLLRRCIETNMLGKSSYIDILFSKMDILESSSERTRALSFIEEIKSEITERFVSSLGRLRFITIAARPTEKRELGEAYGFNDFLPTWIEESPFIRPIMSSLQPVLPQNARMFARFGSIV